MICTSPKHETDLGDVSVKVISVLMHKCLKKISDPVLEYVKSYSTHIHDYITTSRAPVLASIQILSFFSIYLKKKKNRIQMGNQIFMFLCMILSKMKCKIFSIPPSPHDVNMQISIKYFSFLSYCR